MKMQTSFRFRLASSVVTAIIVVLIAAPARAATCTVTSTADSGSGTLREKIGDLTCDTITFAPAIVPGTINFTSGQIKIDRNVTITGPGQDKMTVRRSESAANFRIFEIGSGRVVTISGLAIANGASVTLSGGGGIYNAGTLTLTNSTVAGNTAPGLNHHGGGVRNQGVLLLDRTTVTGNSSSVAGAGGGIYNDGTLTVSNSTFSANSAGGGGGGGIQITGRSSATITNSTFVGNSTYPDAGGGVVSFAPTVSVTNSSFYGNRGGGLFTSSAFQVKNTIVANSIDGPNCFGSIVDGGGNLSYPDTTCPGRIADPLLGPLADNGGPTQTMSLLRGSPALDTAVPNNCPATDQRDVTRPQGGGCDAGAVEAIVTFACPAGTAQAGTLYTSTLAGYGGQSPYTWSIAPAGSLPAGFTLDGSTGTISGTPTATGTFTFPVKVVDSSTSLYATATNNCSIAVAARTVPVTISSSLAGRTFSVTGTGCQPGSYTAPQTLPWTAEASCTVSFTSPQNGGADTQYVFTGWADGGTSASRTITAPAAATTYTANFKTQYQLIASPSPAGSGSITGAGYHDAGSSASVVATPAAGYQFLSWTGPVVSASSASTTVTMNAPAAVTANFRQTTTTTVSNVSGQYSDPVTLSATVSPADAVFSGSIQFQIDGTNAGPPVPVTGGGAYSTSYANAGTAATRTITATLTSTSPGVGGSSGTGTLTVTQEDATLLPAATNPQPAGSAITLTGSLQQAADGSPGDVSLATVTVTLAPSSGSNIDCSVNNTNGALAATCRNVPASTYTVQWRVTGGHYTATPVNTTLEVYDPSITIASLPAGRSFSVTGTGCQPGGYTTPQVLQWTSGASCGVSFTSTQAGGAGTQYVFTNWADGATTASRTITAPGAATTYTANFKTQYQLTASPSPAGSGSITGAGYHDAGSLAAVVATPVAGYQFLAWTGPVASASSPSSTVTMNAPVTVTANFRLLTTTTVLSVSGQYSDPVTLSATAGPAGAVFSGSIQFQLDGVNAGPAIPVTGAGTYTSSYNIGLAAGAHTITATLTSASPIAAGSSGAGTLTVTREDATITPADTNPPTVAVSTPGGVANSVTITGTLQQAPDGNPGDLAPANVTVTLVPALAGDSTINCPVTNSNGALTARCSNVPVEAYAVRWQIAGSYYTGPMVNTVLAVYDPSLGFVTGSGSVLHNAAPADFAISLKYKKDGTLQGGLTWVERRATGDVVMSSTSLTSMSIVGTTALILGNATVNGVGNYTFRATVTDNGNPGANRDLFGLEVNGSPDLAITSAAAAITEGNIQVH